MWVLAAVCTGVGREGAAVRPSSVPAMATAVAGMPTAVAIAMNLFAAAFGARVKSRYHQSYTKPILT